MDETNISMFSGCEVFRFNHVPRHEREVAGRFGTYALNYAHAGALHWSVDGGPSVVLRAPVAYWTWPGPSYRYGPVDGGHWDHYFVSWTGPRARTWQRSGLLPRVAPRRAVRAVSDPAGVRSAFRELYAVLAESPPDDPLAIHLLEGLLLRVQTQRPALEHSTLPAQVQEVIEAVRKRPGDGWDFNTEAQRLGCTTIHLRRVWNSLTGLPPVAYLNKTRMDRAAALLRADRMTLQQIAHEVGYEDVGYFSRLFRRTHGLPPGTYRRSYRTVQ